LTLGAAISLGGSLGGCFGAGGSKPDTAAADPNVLPAQYRAQVAEILRTTLPVVTGIRDGYITEPMLRPVGGANLYVVCVRYNAKGANNVYMGQKDSYVTFLGGRPNQFLDATRELCGSAAWQRYPEIESLRP
jgi:hypothetical protein